MSSFSSFYFPLILCHTFSAILDIYFAYGQPYCQSVGWLARRSEFPKQVGKLHFHAPIEATQIARKRRHNNNDFFFKKKGTLK